MVVLWCAAVVVGVALKPWVFVGWPLGLLLSGLSVGWAATCIGKVRFWTRPCWAASGVLLGVWLAGLTPVGPVLEGPVVLRGVMAGAPSGFTSDVRLGQWARPGEPWTKADGRVRVRFADAPPPPGTAVLIFGAARDVADQSWLPGSPDPVRAAHRVGIQTQVRARSVRGFGGERAGCELPDVTGVLCAIGQGDRTHLDPDIQRLLRRTGTAHLLAISGFHVGTVALIIGSLGRLLLRPIGLLRPGGVLPAAHWWIGALAAVVYCVLAGSPVSAQRATLLVVGVAIARSRGASVRPLGLLGLAALGVVGLDPGAVATAGFQLSFGAVLGILQVTPRLARLIPHDLPRPLPWLISAILTTTGATIGTLPAVAWWFQTLSPTSPIANLLALPWAAFTIVPCAVMALTLPDPFGSWSCTFGTAAVQALVWALTPLSVDPWTPAVGPAGALVLLAPLVFPKRLLTAGLVCFLVLSAQTRATVDRVRFLDVGQGDAALIEGVDGRRILVDGGPSEQAVSNWLRREGIHRLDIVAATHDQKDHIHGLSAVLRTFEVGALWVSEPNTEIEQLARSLNIPVVALPDTVQALSSSENPNDRSLAWTEVGVLFTGDLEREGEAALVARLSPVPVLKAPHHGSRTSSSEALLWAAMPKVAVVSAGRHNRFGHPHADVLDRYQRHGVPVYRTDLLGTLEVRVENQQVRIRGARAGRGVDPWTIYTLEDAWREPTANKAIATNTIIREMP
ncbi:MAG: DNA internalization-related competence protein ComEC/Rec2 [Rhodobacterales bacterium]|nr:DNA internalization-related competence protein ComEC/Rec2 [Rhodobacterales bacterium]